MRKGVAVLLLTSFLAFTCLRGQENDPAAVEKQKRLFSSSIKDSLKEAHRLRTKRQLYWSEHYSKASKTAKEKQKYLLLAFVGSDWCPWSQKLENEVLTRQEFTKALKDDMILVWIDFPENASILPERREINQYLRDKFGVKEFPTLLILDESEDLVAKMAYLPFEAEQFSNQIKGLIGDYKEIKEKIETVNLESLPDDQLETLFTKSKSLSCERFTNELMAAGLKADKGPFFLLERYSELLEAGKRNEPQAAELRKMIAARDPKNALGTQLKLAVLEFQNFSEQHRKKEKIQDAVEPLVEYLKEFGKKDTDNVWRVEMMIAQYFFSKGVIGSALQHAAASFESAPETEKAEIAHSIDYLKSQEIKN
jgi:protein disulfide-isomerase